MSKKSHVEYWRLLSWSLSWVFTRWSRRYHHCFLMCCLWMSKKLPLYCTCNYSCQNFIYGIHISMEDLEENVRVRHIEPINGDGAGEWSSKLKKRFWTKFTHEQRKKMLDFAMTLGWKIKKNDENVEEFCNEIAVKRCVFKVWMYNNKHTHGKK